MRTHLLSCFVTAKKWLSKSVVKCCFLSLPSLRSYVLGQSSVLIPSRSTCVLFQTAISIGLRWDLMKGSRLYYRYEYLRSCSSQYEHLVQHTQMLRSLSCSNAFDSVFAVAVEMLDDRLMFAVSKQGCASKPEPRDRGLKAPHFRPQSQIEV